MGAKALFGSTRVHIRFVAATAAIAASVMLSGCASQQQSESSSSPRDGTIAIAGTLSGPTSPLPSSYFAKPEAPIAPGPLMTALLAKMRCVAVTDRLDDEWSGDRVSQVATCKTGAGSLVKLAAYAKNYGRDLELTLLDTGNEPRVIEYGDHWSAYCTCPASQLSALGGTVYHNRR